MKRIVTAIAMLTVLCLALSAGALERKPFRMKEDFGLEPLAGCDLQYYYYIPCPTFSWFWGFSGWSAGDIIGQYFSVADTPTGVTTACDPGNCFDLVGFSFIDFAGYGTLYPGFFTVEFEVFCSDEFGCPVGDALWSSGPYESHWSWNDIPISPAIVLTPCSVLPGPTPSNARFLLVARHTGTDATYPAWGFDNISWPLRDLCAMHDLGCLPALYPRPYTSHYANIHTGYYGVDFEFCPPYGFLDGLDTTVDGSMYGFVELAFKIAIDCNGPSTDPTTWGRVKSMYR